MSQWSLRALLSGWVDSPWLCRKGNHLYRCRCMACRHQDMALLRQGMPLYLALTASLQGTDMGLQLRQPILAMEQSPSSRPTSSNNQVCCLSSCDGLQASPSLGGFITCGHAPLGRALADDRGSWCVSAVSGVEAHDAGSLSPVTVRKVGKPASTGERSSDGCRNVRRHPGNGHGGECCSARWSQRSAAAIAFRAPARDPCAERVRAFHGRSAVQVMTCVLIFPRLTVPGHRQGCHAVSRTVTQTAFVLAQPTCTRHYGIKLPAARSVCCLYSMLTSDEVASPDTGVPKHCSLHQRCAQEWP